MKYISRAAEALDYSNFVVQRCIEAQNLNKAYECDNLKEILEVFQGALDVAAKERIAGSAFQLSRLGYWQYLITAWIVILIFLVVGASYALLYEASQATKYLKDTLQATRNNSETELQPYLNIMDVYVQTGEPSFGGGDGWIDITFKNLGKTPARNFRHHILEKTTAPFHSQYVEILDGTPVVHTISSGPEGAHSNTTQDTILLDLINIGEEGVVRCPIITDILDRGVKHLYMGTEWERYREGVSLPQFEGYRISGSIDFSNSFYDSTTRRLRFELTDSIDNGKSFKIIEDRKL